VDQQTMQILGEHHVLKMKYGTNIAHPSYFVEQTQSNFLNYTNSLTFP